MQFGNSVHRVGSNNRKVSHSNSFLNIFGKDRSLFHNCKELWILFELCLDGVQKVPVDIKDDLRNTMNKISLRRE